MKTFFCLIETLSNYDFKDFILAIFGRNEINSEYGVELPTNRDSIV